MGRRGVALLASLMAHGILALVAHTFVPRPTRVASRVQLRLADQPRASVAAPVLSTPARTTKDPSRSPIPKSLRSRSTKPPVWAGPPTPEVRSPGAASGSSAETSAPTSTGVGVVYQDSGPKATHGSGPGWTGGDVVDRGQDLGVPLRPPGPALVPPAAPAAPTVALSPRAGGGYVYRDRGFQAEIAHDGTVEFDDHLPVQLGGESTGGLPVATFDLTEAVMMIAGDDPYRADKERFLAATLELRQGLCEVAHQERLRTALFELDRNLDAIWQDQRQAAKARRELLFQLWDECLEPAPETTDLTERTALQARATILGYIQKNLPAGSPSAYPEQELLALNQRRRSKAPFDPYRSERDAGADCE